MLKSGKLKLADDMIVTAQEAANKAETVFTIYDDTTNTQIASGPIGGGGGGGGLDFTKIEVINNVSAEYNTGYSIRLNASAMNKIGDNEFYQIISTTQMAIIQCPQTVAVKCAGKWKDDVGEWHNLPTPTLSYDSEEMQGWVATFQEDPAGFTIDQDYQPSVVFTWDVNQQ